MPRRPDRAPAPNTIPTTTTASSADGGNDAVAADFGNDVRVRRRAPAWLLHRLADGRLPSRHPTPTLARHVVPGRRRRNPGADILTGTDGDDIHHRRRRRRQHRRRRRQRPRVRWSGDDQIARCRPATTSCVATPTTTCSPAAECDDLVYGGTGNDLATGDARRRHVRRRRRRPLLRRRRRRRRGRRRRFGRRTTSLTASRTAPRSTSAKVQAVDANTTTASSGIRRAVARLDSFNPAGASATPTACSATRVPTPLFGGERRRLRRRRAPASTCSRATTATTSSAAAPRTTWCSAAADNDDLFGEGGADHSFGDRTIADGRPTPRRPAVTDQLFGGPDARPARRRRWRRRHLRWRRQRPRRRQRRRRHHPSARAANDDLIGGSDKAAVADVGETLISGGVGQRRHRRRQRRRVTAGRLRARTDRHAARPRHRWWRHHRGRRRQGRRLR